MCRRCIRNLCTIILGNITLDDGPSVFALTSNGNAMKLNNKTATTLNMYRFKFFIYSPFVVVYNYLNMKVISKGNITLHSTYSCLTVKITEYFVQLGMNSIQLSNKIR